MKRIIAVLTVCAVVFPGIPAHAQKRLPKAWHKKMDKAIARHVDSLLKSQEKKGEWSYGGYDVGMTALAVLALKHSNDPRAATAVSRGVQFICQQRTEPKTYSAGMIVSALYQVDPRVHRATISKYTGLLVRGQFAGSGPGTGMYSYWLVRQPRMNSLGTPDNSNTQFGVLGLLFGQRAGYNVPRHVWERLRKHYIDTQNKDGGWGYRNGARSTVSMTLASTVSLYIAEEQIALGASSPCKMAPPSRATEAGMKWVARNLEKDFSAYALYALERLGILTGRSEFGGKYWYRFGADKLLGGGVGRGIGGGSTGRAFIVLFLSRGKEPIIVNKLKYYGDWDNTHYDVKRLTDYISDRMQSPMQWRLVTLEADLDDLLAVPILHFNGIKGPQFTDEEKIKLRNYVLRGGVLMAQAVRGAKDFDEAFRALAAECFPEGELEKLKPGHTMFKTPRKIKKAPAVEVIRFKDRIGVIYLPKGLACDWHRGRDKASLDAGVNIVFYVLKQAGKLGAGASPIRN